MTEYKIMNETVFHDYSNKIQSKIFLILLFFFMQNNYLSIPYRHFDHQSKKVIDRKKMQILIERFLTFENSKFKIFQSCLRNEVS